MFAEIFGAILGLANKLIPDPEDRIKFAAQLQQYEAQIAAAQSATNTVEAGSASFFVAGWRPFIGWCCGAAFVFNSICIPLYIWLATINHWPPPPPLDTGMVTMVLGGMLGLGTMRTAEKFGGIPDTVISSVFGKKK